MRSEFPSKRDAWIMLLLWSGVGISVFAFWAAWPELGRGDLSIALSLTILVCGMLLWLGYGTGYGFEGSQLVIRSGPIRMRVDLAEIDEAVPSRNPLSAPACSLDRIHLKTRTGRGVLISPEDKSGFLSALVLAAPHLRIEGERAVRATPERRDPEA